MKKLLLPILIVLTLGQQAYAQTPDDTNGRLYLTCKVWGYLKYFSQNRCTIEWDTLLNSTLKEVLADTDNTGFNASLLELCNKVGNNEFRNNSLDLPDTNLNFSTSWTSDPQFSQDVRDFLGTFRQHIYPDNSTCFIRGNDYSDPNYVSFIDFRSDTLSIGGNYTKEVDRLLTLFYHWNVINYFHPFKSIMDENWDSTLMEFIPRFRSSTTTTAFQRTFLKYQAKLDDSHGFTNIGVLYGGSYTPEISFRRIGDQCVVRKVNITGIHPGDVLTAINGVAITQIEDSLAESIAASTPAALYRDLYDLMSYGVQNSTINYSLLDSNNNPFTVAAKRNTDGSTWYAWSSDPGVSSSYFLTTCGYGYVNMGMLQSSEVADMYDQFQSAPAIIFDLRNYPNGTLWDLAQYFFPEPIISARWLQPSMLLSGWYDRFDDGSNLGYWSNPEPYSGKIYILVNQETQSQAEYTCQYLSHAANTKVIGSQTAGADGNISYINLPGNIRTYFTSLGWYYDDWYQQQRNGVKIDSVVYPTRAGLRQGKDEVLNAALDCLMSVDNHSSAPLALTVSPNPTTGVATVRCSDEAIVAVTIYNILGNRVATVKPELVPRFTIDLSKLTSGSYIATFVTSSGRTVSKLLVKQ